MQVTQCRLCNGKLSGPKLNLGSTPLANEFLSDKIPQEIFPLEVCVCESCAHYQLNEFIDPTRLFRHYVYVAGTSSVNVQHFKDYANHMVDKFNYQPYDKVLDIASNDGVLLRHFKELGMQVLGIDPAINLAEEATKNGMETIPEFFTESYADVILEKYGTFDLITANNVFAHVPDMIGFARGIKKLLADQGVFSFEVSYFGDVCDSVLFDTIYHEHSSYHTLSPLFSFFKMHGLDLFDVERIPNHGGSIRVFVRKQEDIGIGRWYLGKFYYGESERIRDFLLQEQNIEKKVIKLQEDIHNLGAQLREKIKELKDQGKSLVIYGVPAKATTLMYALGIDEQQIKFAVEDNPLKQNTFTPGKHIPVYSTSKLFEENPDYILILAWNFADSIIKKCKDQGFNGKFIVPLPRFQII